MPPISSRQNPLFKRIREAIREHAAEIVIEGPKPLADALACGWKPIEVIQRGVHFTPELFDALAETKTPQNTIGLFERPTVLRLVLTCGVHATALSRHAGVGQWPAVTRADAGRARRAARRRPR